MLATVAFLSAVSLAVWWSLWSRHVPGTAWVPYEPRRPVPWGLVDLALVVVLLLAANLAVAAVLLGAGGAASQRVAAFDERFVWAQAILSLAVMAASGWMLVLRHRTTAQDLGFVASRLVPDLRLGAMAFLALAPPTYLMQTLLVRVIESKHPLVELLRQRSQPSLVAAMFVTAVLVAPLTEEYLFRGLLQGWLERYAAERGAGWNLLWGGPAQRAEGEDSEIVQVPQPGDGARLAPAPLAVAGEGGGAVATDHPDTGGGMVGEMAPPAAGSRTPDQTAYWPMVASAFIFAVLHLAHGPDWIPLFFFGLGLGYLYRQTHRIVPAIVVHLLLNGCSMLLLLIEIFWVGRRG